MQYKFYEYLLRFWLLSVCPYVVLTYLEALGREVNGLEKSALEIVEEN